MERNNKLVQTSLVIVIVALFALATYYKQSRDFYCLLGDRCVTVWKHVGGLCYVIPGKYYGITKPQDDYILTTNASSLDVIWEGSGPEIIVSMDEKSKIINTSKEVLLQDYNLRKAHYDSLFTYFDGTYKRYKKTTDFISLSSRKTTLRIKMARSYSFIMFSNVPELEKR